MLRYELLGSVLWEASAVTKTEKDKIAKALLAYTKKVTKTPDLAKNALTCSGIYQEDGSLAPEYRDEKAA